MRTTETYKKDIDNLCERGRQLMLGLYNELRDEFEDSFKKLDPKIKADIEKESFKDKYNAWYNESLAVIKQLLPERYNDFKSYYKLEKRKELSYETYTVSDYFINIQVTRNGYEVIAQPQNVISKFEQQLKIVESLRSRFDSSLFEIKQLLQADLFDSELDAARELLKNGFLRASGAICGVILEKHLGQVCTNHSLSLRKKNPAINDYNQLLKDENVIDVPTWRLIQRLADIRNLCDHNKEREPKKDETEDLINGVDKVIKELF